MLTLQGMVLNTYAAPTGTNKDGETYGGGHKLQLLVNNILQNGETKQDVVTLTTDQPELFQGLKGRTVSLPVGVFSPSRGQVSFYIPKGATERIRASSTALAGAA